MRIPAYRRDVFLDVVKDEGRILAQFRKLLRVAELQGYAIGICHPYPETIRMLPDLLRQAEEQGYEWVTVSQLDTGEARSQARLGDHSVD